MTTVSEPKLLTRLRGNPWAVLAVLSLAYFLTQLDVAVLAVAVPSIMADLDASADQVVWSLSAYIFLLAMALITAGRLGDLYGRRRIFLIGVAVFTAASVAAGLAQGPGQLIAARAVQGLGAALLTPQTLALLMEAFPPDRRGTAFGIRGAVGGIAAISGPAAGGVLVSTLDWRWIFWLNLPLGLLMLVVGRLVLPEVAQRVRRRLDVTGVVLASAVLFCLAFGISQGERYGWNAGIWATLGVSGVCVAAFLAQQRRRQDREPLVPFTLFRQRNFPLMNGFSLTTSGTVIGLVLVLSLYFQQVLGLDAWAAGLMIVPASLFSTLLDPVAGKLADRVQGRYLLLVGAVATVAGMAWAAVEMRDGATWTAFVAPMCVIGVGNAFLFTPLAVVALSDVEQQQAGAASGVLITSLQIGSMLGAAAVGALLHNQIGEVVTIGAARAAMLLLAGVAVLGSIACLVAGPNLTRTTSQP
ncbi:DHA2 family efflux MFS transporter permease subunit [Solwaraspora sp. WMMA2080]|uniref:DHA2 family efflux MFS transporter permease subunit n=1 Tax=unclassified Solwaraspora TaxID=2627926 RepID=UPI00248C7304|nr:MULTISPECIES: DHA2 family efflux MFS transporter permease subunit [unclassified Solwaraspora]WBB98686.1 DHA2 family efflux MFS transporter permease subunit [Solwaraspora sp. WMMA2059]WBC22761.1 DHA2 family efflux MFS transporter permease subunit [Solwaraspora sp. WMMA2080]